MLRRLLLLALLASASATAADTYRFGTRLVEVGDSASKLTELAGPPGYKEPIETAQGGREGERWQYTDGPNTITFVIKQGRIESIEQKHN
jgi:hypothetical protein